jgi:hypothetical protein
MVIMLTNSSEMNMMAFRLTLGAPIGVFPEPVDPQEVKKVVEIFNTFPNGNQMIGKKIPLCIQLVKPYSWKSPRNPFRTVSLENVVKCNWLVRNQVGDLRIIKKASSCSTIYIDDSTVSQPNLKNTIKVVSLAIYYHIKNRTSNQVLDIFDEKLHPLTRDGVPSDYNKYDPEHRQIYKFIRTLFNAAQLTAECAIVTLVYIERLIKYAEVDIAPGSWKRITLMSILLASKVWDDQAVWNVDYCQILKDLTVEDMNELERQFLEMLQFNINVPSSVYAKYYFDLRTLAEANDLSFPAEPLSKERASKLEAMSQQYEDKLSQEMLQNGIKKPSNTDKLSFNRRSVAILS